MSDTADDGRHGDGGEAWFQSLATDAGFTVSPPHRDRHGWDFHLQDRIARETTGSLDERPAEFTCYVQVKTTTRKRRGVRVKLDNWERFAKNVHPCFFAVVKLDAHGRRIALYLVHVGKAWIEETLRTLRKLPDEKGTAIHKVGFDLLWDDDDLCPMEDAVLRTKLLSFAPLGMDEYSRQKALWNRTVGYPERPLKMSVTIAGTPGPELWTRMSDFAVGRERTLSASRFIVSRERFGISRVEQDVGSGDGRLELRIGQPTPSRKARLVISNSDDSVALECVLRTSRSLFPQLPPEFEQVVLQAAILSFCVTDASYSFEWSIEPAEQEVRLSALAAELRALRMLATSNRKRVEIEVQIDDARSSVAWSSEHALDGDVAALIVAVESAAEVVRRFGLVEDPVVSVAQLAEQRVALGLLAAIASKNVSGFEVTIRLRAEDRVPRNDRFALVVRPSALIGEEVFVSTAAIVTAGSLDDLGGDGRTWNGRGQEARVSQRRIIARGGWEEARRELDSRRDDFQRELLAEGLDTVIWRPTAASPVSEESDSRFAMNAPARS